MNNAGFIQVHVSSGIALCHMACIPGNVSAELLSDEKVAELQNVIQSTLLDR